MKDTSIEAKRTTCTDEKLYAKKNLFDSVAGLCWDKNVLFVCSASCAPICITQSIPVKTVGLRNFRGKL